MTRVALLLEKPDGTTVAVVCNSRDAADHIAEHSPFERVGLSPIVTFTEAMTPDTKEPQ